MSAPGCLAISLVRADGRDIAQGSASKGLRLFQDFQAANSALAPRANPALAASVGGLEFVGLQRSGTLIVAGAQLHLECLRGAFARNVLRPPTHCRIKDIGDPQEVAPPPAETRFYPLGSALCSLISSLNGVGHPATPASLHLALRHRFSTTATPPLVSPATVSLIKECNQAGNFRFQSPWEAVEASLSALLAEGRLYCMGQHYFLATPEMVAQFEAQKSLIAQATQWGTVGRAAKGTSSCREIETQTGESIVCGIPAYRPKPSAKAASAQPCTSQPPPKEKPVSFFRRLFRRSKSRDGLNRVAQSTLKAEAPAEMPGSRRSSLTQPTEAPLSTFTAQFPPSEWLHDPRQFRVPKAPRRTKERRPERNSVWIDLEPSETPPPTSARRPRNDHRLVSGLHYPTCPDQLSRHTGRHSPKPERRSHRHRMNKYLSSSSEALHPIALPRDYDSKRRARKHHHHYPQAPTHYNLDNRPLLAPLAAPTATDLDSTLDQTETAVTNFAEDARTPVAQTTAPKSGGNRVSDSALSASPVVTEMSSSSNKYSSWSGSEGQHPRDPADPSYVNLPKDAIPEEQREDALPSPILARRRGGTDPTYENLELESTRFENMTLEGDDDAILAADASLHLHTPTYISAL